MAAGNHPAGPPPKEAVDYLRRKGVRTGYDYREVWREEHAVAFTVANMMKVSMLTDVQRSIEKAQEEGWPADRWKKEMAEELAKRGWWGRMKPPDPKDPQAVAKANLYMSRRLDTIWRVNTRQAAQAGVWERGQRSKSHPYILYRVGPSKQHRDQHLAWDGVLLPKDDPFWAVANPMNGWGCKCYTRFVSRAQYERYKRNGLPGKKAVVTEEPRLTPRKYTNPVNGRDYVGYDGIDDGFEHNPGAGRMEQLAEQYRNKTAAQTLPPAKPAQPTAERPGLKPVSDSLKMEIDDPDGRRKVEAGIAAVAKVHSVEGLPRIPVREMDFEGYEGWLARRPIPGRGIDALTSDSIHINPTKWRPDWVVVHEIGHFLDLDALAATGDFASEQKSGGRTWELVQAAVGDLKKTSNCRLLEKLREEAVERGDKKSIEDMDYLLDPKELFARSYAQYIAWRSGDAALLERLDRLLTHDDPRWRLRQWPYDQYLPLVERFDTLFENLGWLARPKNT